VVPRAQDRDSFTRNHDCQMSILILRARPIDLEFVSERSCCGKVEDETAESWVLYLRAS
jgi:hypothetical protein